MKPTLRERLVEEMPTYGTDEEVVDFVLAEVVKEVERASDEASTRERRVDSLGDDPYDSGLIAGAGRLADLLLTRLEEGKP